MSLTPGTHDKQAAGKLLWLFDGQTEHICLTIPTCTLLSFFVRELSMNSELVFDNVLL